MISRAASDTLQRRRRNRRKAFLNEKRAGLIERNGIIGERQHELMCLPTLDRS